MERIHRFFSVIMIVLIGCVTVLQYHHHHADGIVFFLTCDDDTDVESSCCGCQQTDRCADSGGDESNCGLHLTDALTIDGSEQSVYAMWCCHFIALYLNFDFAESMSSSDVLWGDNDDICTSMGYSRTTVLRGPPIA